MVSVKKMVLLAVLSTAFVGCASDKEPSFGEKVQSNGAALKGIGQQWSEGEGLITKGKKLISSGKEDIEDGDKLIAKGRKLKSSGEEDILEGEKLIRRGIEIKSKAENAYKNHSEDLVPGQR